MTSFAARRQRAALDALFGDPRANATSCCRALDRALDLLRARHDDSRAAQVLVAITGIGALADAIAVEAERPADAKPERGRLLVELWLELERAHHELFCAEMIDSGPRFERETAAARARIAAIRGQIDEQERGRA